MRIHVPGQDVTLEAAADLSTHQFKFMIGAAAGSNGQNARVDVSGANGRAFCVLQNKPSVAGQGAVVRLTGRSKLVVDGSGTGITVGLPLKSDASGRGVSAAANKDRVGAIALEASSAANDIIDALVSVFDISA